MASQDEKKVYDDPLNGAGLPDETEEYTLEEILSEYGAGRRDKLMRDVEEEAAPIAAEEMAGALPPEPERTAEKAPEPETAGDGGAASAGTGAEPEKKAGGAAALRPGALKLKDMKDAAARAFQAGTEKVRAAKPERSEKSERPAAEETPGAPAQEAPGDLTSAAVPADAAEEPDTPRAYTLEEVVGGTVDAVLEEHAAEEPLVSRRRWSAFSRRGLEETEELFQKPSAQEDFEEEQEEETIGPEPEDLRQVEARFRDETHHSSQGIFGVFCLALFPLILLEAESRGAVLLWWNGNLKYQALVLLACLLGACLLGRRTFRRAGQALRERHCTGEVLICTAAAAACADCLAQLLLPTRTSMTGYAPVVCMAIAFAMWGSKRESRGMYLTFRTAAVDSEPPYLVTDTEQGACKQRGSVPGFYTTALRENLTVRRQTALLPIILAASLAFACVSSMGRGRSGDFFLNWSAILCASGTFALPLCWGLPFSSLARHLQRSGCAVAGWAGAEAISAQGSMILTDTDLFPPGTLRLNGVKLFGEEMPRMVAYAATLARCAGSGLQRLFDDMLRSELGEYEEADDFAFYEEGGYSATIHGETVLLGTAEFMREMGVHLPDGINLRTGIFLAVDRQITVVFAVKYEPSENVDYALQMMKNSHVSPILASRDPNIVPALIKRKFRRSVKMEYPDLSTRVALSEVELDRGMPRALLLREGLLPFADAVVGSRRLCRAVRQLSALTLFSSAAGMLLAFYLVFNGAYALLSPSALVCYLLLWVLPVLLLTDWVGRY